MPAFNRAYTLPRALKSIESQDYRNFEVVVVDDGSTDDTYEVIASWSESVDFPVQYLYQMNHGKNVAHNTMLAHARGEFVVLLDSDDMLAPTALSSFEKNWEAIPAEQRDKFAGVEGLCAYLPDHKLAGKEFPQDPLDATHIEMRIKYRVKGEKRSAIRTDVLRQYPYPSFEGERHIRPSILWDHLSEAGYMFRFFNEIVQIMEHQADGLSANRFKMRMANPQGLRLCIREEIRLHAPYLKAHARRRLCGRYARYSLHLGEGLFRQWREVGDRRQWLLGLPGGILGWLGDHVRKVRLSEKSKSKAS